MSQSRWLWDTPNVDYKGGKTAAGGDPSPSVAQLLLGAPGGEPTMLEVDAAVATVAADDESESESETPLQRVERLAGGSLGISEEDFDAVPHALREAVITLAHERKSALKLRSEWEAQVQAMRTQILRAESESEQLKKAFNECDRELADTKQKLESLRVIQRKENNKFLSEKTDLVKRCAQLEGRDKNHLAVKKRLELDNEKLMKKIESGLKSDAKTQRGSTAKGSLAASRSVGKSRATAAAGKSASSAASSGLEVLFTPYVERERRLMAENKELRDMLDDVSTKFEALHTTFTAFLEAQPAPAPAPADESDGESAVAAPPPPTPVANPRVIWWTVDAKNDLCDRIASLHDRMANGHVTVGSNGAEPVLFSPRPPTSSASSAAETTRDVAGEGTATATGPGADMETKTETAALQAKLARKVAELAEARSMLVEQDKLIHAALFGEGGCEQGGALEARDDMSFQAELGEELEAQAAALAAKEKALVEKENELVAVAERMDQERINLETAKLFESSRKGPLRGTEEGGLSPILKVDCPATPATRRILSDLGISANCVDEDP